MRKNLFIFNFKLLAILGLVLAWAATDYLVARSEKAYRFLSFYSEVAFDNPLQIHYKISRARHEPGKKLVIVLGSSIAREAIGDAIVEKELGDQVQVLNFGFFHGRAPDFWMLSGEVLRLKPDLVVMPMVSVENIEEYSFGLTMPYYFHPNIFQLVGAKEVMANPHEFFYAWLGRLSFLFRYRDTIVSAVMRASKDAVGMEAWHPREAFRFSNEVERLPTLDPKLSFFGQDYAPGKELIIKALDHLFALFRENKVPVVILPLPYHPKFESEVRRLNLNELLDWDHREFPLELKRWEETLGVKSAKPESGLLLNSFRADYVHLNSAGRLAYSQWFARWLISSGFAPRNH